MTNEKKTKDEATSTARDDAVLNKFYVPFEKVAADGPLRHRTMQSTATINRH
uniref:Uncharacterized protein n=1 Tax=Arundo donax TaxID=35708 RepID=A0A0A9DQR2_ARUDO